MIPDPRMHDEDEYRHAHRWDLTPAMVACDPTWTRRPEGNPFYLELTARYGADAAYALWELAAEWHEQVTTCFRCNGEGVIWDHSSPDPQEHWDKPCPRCRTTRFVPPNHRVRTPEKPKEKAA